ncbi:MAG: GerW family sporulation protein [Lachnospiraceae bacterium]|nr:GerW family sporulation protein [Lachnospiraceae bacterium]
MANVNIDNMIDSLMKGMEGFFSTKTVVGEPKKIDDTIIIPLVDVTFGMGTGAGSNENKASGGGGIGGKMTPSAILIISKGGTKLINIKNQDAVTKILDMVPDVINRLTERKDGQKELSDKEVMDLAFDSADEKDGDA